MMDLGEIEDVLLTLDSGQMREFPFNSFINVAGKSIQISGDWCSNSQTNSLCAPHLYSMAGHQALANTHPDCKG